MESFAATARQPWSKGKIVGQKAPFKLKEVWAIRIRLQLARRERELALFDLGIDSKLRACDLVQLRVRDICHGDRIATRAIVMQQKTQGPVQFEITQQTREAVSDWIRTAGLHSDDFLFPSPRRPGHLSTRQYSRIVRSWVAELGEDPCAYATHSIRTLCIISAKKIRKFWIHFHYLNVISFPMVITHLAFGACLISIPVVCI